MHKGCSKQCWCKLGKYLYCHFKEASIAKPRAARNVFTQIKCTMLQEDSIGKKGLLLGQVRKRQD